MMTTTINTMTAKTMATDPGNGNWVRHAKCPWSSWDYFCLPSKYEKMASRLIGNYHGREYHHYYRPTLLNDHQKGLASNFWNPQQSKLEFETIKLASEHPGCHCHQTLLDSENHHQKGGIHSKTVNLEQERIVKIVSKFSLFLVSITNILT